MDANIRLSTYQTSTVKKGYYQMKLIETARIEEQITPAVSTQEIDFVMSSNRFTMDSTLVYSTYPPADSKGEFGTCLPHIILRNASYPWDHGYRSIDNNRNIPGIAVFLFSDDDADEYKVREQTISVNQVYQEISKIYTPKKLKMSNSDNENGEEECCILDIPVSMFRSICPKEAELQLLSHVKEVSLDNKEHDPIIENGIFSCITANRFPVVSDTQNRAIKHTAYLVSLVEYEEYLQMSDTEQTKELKGYSHVRVIQLYKWNFYTTKEPYNFLSVVKKITPNVLCYTPNLAVHKRYEDKALLNILRKGYYPLNHDLRDGSKTVSWYRGPLLPILFHTVEPRYHVFADELYYLDPEIGMFDVSYACAWKLGRMLSLQNLSLCQELLLWRMKNCNTAAKQKQTREILNQVLPKSNLLTTNTSSQETEVGLKEVLHDLCKDMVDALPSYKEDYEN